MRTRRSEIVIAYLVLAAVLVIACVMAAPARAGEGPEKTPTEVVEEAVRDGDAVIVTPTDNQPVVITRWGPGDVEKIIVVIATTLIPSITALVIALLTWRSGVKTQAQVTTEAAHSRAQDARISSVEDGRNP